MRWKITIGEFPLFILGLILLIIKTIKGGNCDSGNSALYDKLKAALT